MVSIAQGVGSEGSWEGIVGRDTVATFMIIVKSSGNGLIVILHRTAGGQTGGGVYMEKG